MNVLLITLLLFVASPFSLEMSRWPCAAVVGALLLLSFLLLRPRQNTAVFEPFMWTYLAFLSFNFLYAAFIAGNSKVEAAAELIQPLEVTCAFILFSSLTPDSDSYKKWLKWILILVSIRALYQISMLAAGQTIMPQIYGEGVTNNSYSAIGSFTFVRLIDPVAGLFVPISVTLYMHGIHKKLALCTAFLCSIVSLLGMTRCEWIASLAFLSLAAALKGSKAIKGIVAVGAFVILCTWAIGLVLPEFAQAIEDRVFQHTAEQLDAKGNSIERLRIVELDVAKEEFQRSPLFSQGVGAHLGAMVLSDGGQPMWIHFHNSYVNMLTNIGLFGMSLFAYLIYRVGKFGWALHRMARIDIEHANATLAIGSLMWWGIVLAFQPIYVAYHIPVLIGAFFGMGLSMSLGEVAESTQVEQELPYGTVLERFRDAAGRAVVAIEE